MNEELDVCATDENAKCETWVLPSARTASRSRGVVRERGQAVLVIG